MDRSKTANPIKGLFNALFILCVFAFLLYGAYSALFRPTEVNDYENRTANQFPAVTLSGFRDGSVQDAVENALRDQVHLAQDMEEDYFYCDTSFQMKLIQPFLAAHPDRYIGVLGQYTFGGTHLVYATRPLEGERENLDARIENINAAVAAHPELHFYAYYIEKDTDLDLFTGKKAGISEYILDNLSLPRENMGVFTVDSFAELDEKFFRTDHHWNNRGSYEGYCDVLALLKPDARPLVPLEEITLRSNNYSGSKANTIGAKGVFTESFPVYVFDYPPMEIIAEGQSVEHYGNQDAWIEGKIWSYLSYSTFYGGDLAEVIFDTHKPEEGKLLVLGESYDNAILQLLASHFGQLYSVDLRNYERVMGKPFDLGAYTRENGITQVLLLGNLDYFVAPDFDLEG